MDGLIALAFVVALAIPVAIIVLIILIVGLRSRVSSLESQVRTLWSYPQLTGAVVADADVVKSTFPTIKRAESRSEESIEAPPVPQETRVVAEPPPIPEFVPPPPAADGPVVLTAARASALGDWLKTNWVYAISAISLAMAGVFFVQYGMEKGLLPPAARVGMALLFGLALVAAGEWLRRRSGDGPDATTAYLPSTFASAGLVSMFAGILAARQLYGLIGVETAFVGLVAVAALSVLLGWFYGPFLAAVGLIGATVAPFIVGGSSDAAYWLYAYFALIGAAGLAIDAMRRWAWLSVLALALAYGGGVLVLMASGGEGWFFLFLTAIALLAVLVPCRSLNPDQGGPMLSEALWARGKTGWPLFPARIAAGSMAVSSLGLTLTAGQGPADGIMAFFCLTLMAGALIFWSVRARALSDLAALPAAGFIARLALEGTDGWPLAWDYSQRMLSLRAPEVSSPMTAALLLVLAVAVTLLAAWRSGRGAEYRAIWAAGAALFAPVSAVTLELFWAPSLVIGAYPWALHVIVLAAMMGFLATRFAAADGEDRRRAAYAALATLSLIALALFLILTKGALTLALAALVLVAAALDRRFRLPEMTYFIQAAVVGLSWRLVVDPGLPWAIDEAALWEVIASYGGAAAAMVGGLRILEGMDRRNARVFLESAGAAYAALFANVLITRWLTDGASEPWVLSHWALTLNAMPWLILVLTQLYRLQLGGALRWLRWAIAAVGGLAALAGIGAAATAANPLFGLAFGGREGLVYGPPVLDTLLVAYALPGVFLVAALRWLGHLPPLLRHAMLGIGTALLALYAGLEIRRFWQGDDLSGSYVSQGELYSYTVALLVIGAGLLYQAIARNSVVLRRAAMAVIGLTVAKVFLIDVAGLTGLTRVFSLLALGLSLAGLAFLNRWAARRQAGDQPPA